jgi:ferredoxin
MAEAAKQIEEKKGLDKGLEVGIQNLTEERIEKVINRVLKGESGARLKAYVDTCIHCGLCSEACHYYLSHDNDPHYSPVGKVKQTPPSAIAASAAPCTVPSGSILPI